MWPCRYLVGLPVSTHSRPKAAAQTGCRAWRARQCFNSQPPEGGCGQRYDQRPFRYRFNSQPPEGGCRIAPAGVRGDQCFNSQPPEGGCLAQLDDHCLLAAVSTHSRPKAAAHEVDAAVAVKAVFQLTAARRRLRGVDASGLAEQLVSTHSRPKAAAPKPSRPRSPTKFQLTAARRRLLDDTEWARLGEQFQLTAARRRLPADNRAGLRFVRVSTHSRPEAAAHPPQRVGAINAGFNSQPPEGGCPLSRRRAAP